MSDHLNLARELAWNFLEYERVEAGNKHLHLLLDSGDEYEPNLLPGNTTAEVCANLQTILSLAGEPAPMPSAGRDRVGRQWRSQRQRDEIKLFTRVCLALLGGDESGGIFPGAI
jgi:hypothetical protein